MNRSNPQYRWPRPGRYPTALCLAALLLLLFTAAPVTAQENAVTGRVIDAETREPVSDAQVQVVGTQRGALSQTNGRFLILNVSGNQVTLRVTRIGYQTLERSVSVGDAGITLVLEPTALELDAIVVTGTPGEQRVRAIGNAVGQVEATEVAEIAAPTDVRQLIGGRVPGVNMITGQGSVGSGGPTTIRGVGSLELGTEPLVYLDGVRIDSDPSQGGTGSDESGGAARINDINPEDIESIEIIKGPAATTLYGTEASNGVIQIITKRGRVQEAQWNFRMDQGIRYMPNPAESFPMVYGRSDGEVVSLNIIENDIATGFGSPFSTGRNQSYGASVQGGVDDVQYFLSGDWGREEGVVSYNWQNRLNLRSNLSFVLGDQLDMQFNLGTVRMETEGGAIQPFTAMMLWGVPALKDTPQRGYILFRPEDYLTAENIEKQDRTIYSLQLNHHPTEWLNQRLILGNDHGFRRGHTLYRGSVALPGPLLEREGSKEVSESRTTLTTVDYILSAGLDVTPSLRSETAVGGSFFRRLSESSSASGEVVPINGLELVSNTANRGAGEAFGESRSVGAFVQQQFSFEDRLFLTAGVRGDDHSTFGRNYDFVTYPKLMASWVVSEESFLQDVDFLTSLKLRAAWGQAGNQPSSNAALRTYSTSTGNNATPTVTPGNVGNQDIEPEKSEEIEFGFDASLFDDRLGLELTYYSQTTTDAILERAVLPSTGFSGSQDVNLGEVANSGLELAFRANPIRSDNLRWNLNVAVATNENEIVSLGGLEFPPGTTTRTLEGFPINGIFMQKVVSAEYDANDNLINVRCDGGAGPSGFDSGGPAVDCGSAPRVYWGTILPKWQGSVATTLTLFEDLRLYALAEFQGGNMRVDNDVGGAHLFFGNTLCINQRPICDPELAAYASLGQVWQTGTHKAGFAKMRTLSASYTLPSSVVSLVGASRGTLTLASQNPFRIWTEQNEVFGRKVVDPETGRVNSPTSVSNQDGWPVFTTFTTSIRLSF